MNVYEVSSERVAAARVLISGHEAQLVARMLSTLPNDLVPVHTDITLMLDVFSEKYPARFVSQVCAFVFDEVMIS